MATRPMVHFRQTPLVLLVSVLAVSVLTAKKAQPVILDWKMGILWESPDACNETSPIWKATFLILADDTLYHVVYTPILHKPNVTERMSVRYVIANGDFYLEDQDGRIFKLSIVKNEQDPTAQERFKSGRQQCQPE